MISFLSRHLVTTLLIGALVLGGMWYFFSADGESGELLTTTTAGEAENPAEKGIVDTLLTLRAVSLSGTIFSDPVFAVLKDFGSEIIPEPTGRINPFAPRDTKSTGTSGSGASITPPRP